MMLVAVALEHDHVAVLQYEFEDVGVAVVQHRGLPVAVEALKDRRVLELSELLGREYDGSATHADAREGRLHSLA